MQVAGVLFDGGELAISVLRPIALYAGVRERVRQLLWDDKPRRTDSASIVAVTNHVTALRVSIRGVTAGSRAGFPIDGWSL